MATWFAGPGPEHIEEDASRIRDQELDSIAERERGSDESVPHRHPIRRFFARFRRKR